MLVAELQGSAAFTRLHPHVGLSAYGSKATVLTVLAGRMSWCRRSAATAGGRRHSACCVRSATAAFSTPLRTATDVCVRGGPPP